MKKRLQRKLTLTRETVRHLELRHVTGGALPTTPIGTCPETDPAVCGGTGGGSTTPLPCWEI
jgi:hypothetical protein